VRTGNNKLEDIMPVDSRHMIILLKQFAGMRQEVGKITRSSSSAWQLLSESTCQFRTTGSAGWHWLFLVLEIQCHGL